MVMLLEYFANPEHQMQPSNQQAFPMPDLEGLIGQHVPIYDLSDSLQASNTDFLDQLGYVGDNQAKVKTSVGFLFETGGCLFETGETIFSDSILELKLSQVNGVLTIFLESSSVSSRLFGFNGSIYSLLAWLFWAFILSRRSLHSCSCERAANFLSSLNDWTLQTRKVVRKHSYNHQMRWRCLVYAAKITFFSCVQAINANLIFLNVYSKISLVVFHWASLFSNWVSVSHGNSQVSNHQAIINRRFIHCL